MTARAVRIGLTGPIGCGKSTVARWLGELRARSSSMPTPSPVTPPRPASRPSTPCWRGSGRRWSGDGRHARPGGARPGSCSPTRRRSRDLEAIVHPAVRPRILAAMAAAEAAGAAAVVIEAIKLVEGGLAALCDEVWLVAAMPPLQRERLIGRGDPRRRRPADRGTGRDRERVARWRPACSTRPATLPETRDGVAAAWAAAVGQGAGDAEPLGSGEPDAPGDGEGDGLGVGAGDAISP